MEEKKEPLNVYSQLSDIELLRRAKEGDEGAFEYLHNRYREKILNYSYRLVGKYETAEDITQETFIRVYNGLAKFRGENVAGWIYTIARNLSLNELKKMKQERSESLYEVV